MGSVWPQLVPYFYISVSLRALSWKSHCYHVIRRACHESSSIEARGDLRQRQAKLTPRWAKTMCTFYLFFLRLLAICQFVLAKVVSRRSSDTYACVGNSRVFQKIHSKRLGGLKVRRMRPTLGKACNMRDVCNLACSWAHTGCARSSNSNSMAKVCRFMH